MTWEEAYCRIVGRLEIYFAAELDNLKDTRKLLEYVMTYSLQDLQATGYSAEEAKEVFADTFEKIKAQYPEEEWRRLDRVVKIVED
jgi:hypothetical protein